MTIFSKMFQQDYYFSNYNWVGIYLVYIICVPIHLSDFSLCSKQIIEVR